MAVPAASANILPPPDKCAIGVEITLLPVFRQQPHHRDVEIEMADTAQQEDPGPHENIDAVVVAADPARQNNLGQVQQSSAGQLNAESNERVALRAGAVIGPGYECGQEIADASDHVADPYGERREAGRAANGMGKFNRHGYTQGARIRLKPLQPRDFALADALSHSRPGPRPPGIPLLTMKTGKKFRDFGGQIAMTPLQHLGHEFHIARGGGCVLFRVPSA
jgi:hypothetical protein